MEAKKSRILLAAMPDSVHVARWLEANSENDIEVVLFATSPLRKMHPNLRALMKNTSFEGLSIKRHWLSFYGAIPLWILDRPYLFDGRIRGALLKKEIKRFNPQILHIMESQNGGYLARWAIGGAQNSRPKTLLTLFGSDLYWFSKIRPHKNRLRALLSKVDFIQAECARDFDLALGLGFRGIFLPVMPVSGGLSENFFVDEVRLGAVNERTTIAIKGYGGTWGLAKEALKAIRGMVDQLQGFKIEIFSAGPAMDRFARSLFKNTGIEIATSPKFSLSHAQMLDLFQRSLVYVGYSKSDGLPASMLEAMSQGAFPVQTNTACVEGWFRPGITGIAVDDVASANMSSELAGLISDPVALEKAARENRKTVLDRYSSESLHTLAGTVYKRVLSSP